MKPWLLVSPASRGIGFCLARQLLKTTTAPVVVTARQDVKELKEKLLKDTPDIDERRLQVLRLDFLDEDSIADAASHCAHLFPPSSHLLHLAYILPGILHPEKSPAQLDYAKTLLTFQTNTLGPLIFTKHFAPFLPTKKSHTDTTTHAPETWRGLDPRLARWIFMSARVGSVSDNRLGGWYSYRASKAALNQVVKTFDVYVQARAGANGMAVAMHPGTVKTQLSKEFWGNVSEEKLLEPLWVAERLVQLCTGKDGVGVEGRGRCWDYDGREVLP